MKLYTVVWQGQEVVCVENPSGKLTILPYRSMNDLLTDDPESRKMVLEGDTPVPEPFPGRRSGCSPPSPGPGRT